VNVEHLCNLLRGKCPSGPSEAELSVLVRRVLAEHCIEFQAEVILGPKDRIDFAVGENGALGVGIELKVKGSPAAIIRQLNRYANYNFDALLLVTTSRRLAASVPRELLGKRVATAVVGGI